jgi:hypothetical protein
LSCLFQAFGVILKKTQAGVAPEAKQGSDFSGDVVVVNGEKSALTSARVINAANSATSLLPFEHSVVVCFGHSMVAPQLYGSPILTLGAIILARRLGARSPHPHLSLSQGFADLAPSVHTIPSVTVSIKSFSVLYLVTHGTLFLKHRAPRLCGLPLRQVALFYHAVLAILTVSVGLALSAPSDVESGKRFKDIANRASLLVYTVVGHAVHSLSVNGIGKARSGVSALVRAVCILPQIREGVLS